MNILINYADKNYQQAQRLNSWTGKRLGKFDKILSFGPEDIEEDFRKSHSEIFSYKRGNGLWLWKSYFVNKVVNESKDGDYIFYIDAGAFFIRDPRVLLKYITDENPIFVTDIPLLECNFTKQECFDIMGGEEFKQTNQIQSGIIIFKVNQFTRSFFKEYFELSSTTRMLIPEGLGKKEQPINDFGNSLVSHREDQSILSLLCKIKGIETHRDITNRGKDEFTFYNQHYSFLPVHHPKDDYPTILYLHKIGKFSLRNILVHIYSKLMYKLKYRRRNIKHYRLKYEGKQ